MFDKSLFYKVEGADDLFQKYSWTRYEWEQFFGNLRTNINTSTEQWNKQTRKELEDRILHEIDLYMSLQRDLKESAANNKIIHPNLVFGERRRVVVKNEYFRWNNEEFDVEYPSLQNSYKVGKYYLSVLLNEKPVVPYMIEVITSPITFWHELNNRFIC